MTNYNTWIAAGEKIIANLGVNKAPEMNEQGI